MANADPIKAAEDLAGSTYAGAQERTAAGKKALLDGLAANGTYQNTIDGANIQQAGQPVGAQPTPGRPMENLSTQGAGQVNGIGQATLAAAAALGAQQRAQQQQASSNYFEQVGAAIPIEQSRSQSDAAQVLAALVQEREQRANALQMQQLQLQQQRESLAASKEARLAKTNGTEALSPAEKANLREEMFNSFAPDSWFDENGNPQRRAQAYQMLATNPELDPSEVFRRVGLTDPAGQGQVVDALNSYFGALDQNGYYVGSQRPNVTVPEAPGGNRLEQLRRSGGW